MTVGLQVQMASLTLLGSSLLHMVATSAKTTWPAVPRGDVRWPRRGAEHALRLAYAVALEEGDIPRTRRWPGQTAHQELLQAERGVLQQDVGADASSRTARRP